MPRLAEDHGKSLLHSPVSTTWWLSPSKMKKFGVAQLLLFFGTDITNGSNGSRRIGSSTDWSPKKLTVFLVGQLPLSTLQKLGLN